MKCIKILFSAALILMVCSAFSLKKEKAKPVYAFGFAASFTDDSTVYFTDIQLLDSVQLVDGFLPLRERYSNQLENYVEGEGLQQNSTCMIYFSESRKKLEKDATKLMNKYLNGKKVEKLSSDKFRFTKPKQE